MLFIQFYFDYFTIAIYLLSKIDMINIESQYTYKTFNPMD